MEIIKSKDKLRKQLVDWRHAGEHIAIVPTMGNLHAGHISLVNIASEHAERVVVTIFVNPTQFGEGEDFDHYPRSHEKDVKRLEKAAADVLFAPDVATVYPFGIDNATLIVVPGLTENFCGTFRPGHFDGVTTVVARLFALVQPDFAVFGQKDYQQQLVIRRMTEDLSLPIDILSGPTVREVDGLAMSSRNTYLTEAERNVAPSLYRILETAGDELRNGDRNFDDMEQTAHAALIDAGFQPEYVAIRQALDLSVPSQDCNEFVVLAAVHLGRTRLIDNVLVSV
jgi:pantoate--beta-alanine ligase